ncbi:MAG: hypothetical protein DF168_01111 [Candidatus Moanabacter tarae]|uniref:Uncharacterized protein n=1 Tax=Candidatus Moanibacter tarae TaxID=2200854 RepID=A0A2Z4AHW5_9BACT|nr:MAG: hypothetical protein DF168_01111 [Candidatus Moanabacter tarae]
MSMGNKAEGSKRRKIIHWNPDGDSRRDKSQTKKQGNSLVFGIAVVLLLILSLAGIYGARKYLGLGGEVITPVVGPSSSPGYENGKFVSRERVDRMRAAVRLGISEIRKITDDHPRLIENLVIIETAFDEGNRQLASTAYREALAKFEEVRELVEEMRETITEKEKAKEVYDEFLAAVEKDEGMRIHAPYEYEKAVAYGNEGTGRFENGEFIASISDFEQAMTELKEVEIAAELFIAEKEIEGKIAFSKGEKAISKQIFSEILTLQPDNELAKRNLERALNIDILVSLLKKAKKQENDGDLEGALITYEKAFKIDTRSARAQQGVTRVRRNIEKNNFDNFVSAAKAAEEKEDWDAAITTLEAATKMFPDKEGFAEDLARVREVARLAKVKDARSRALAFENDYEWIAARDSFIEVLELDRGNKEATDGLLRTGNLVRVLLRYNQLLEQAQELANQGEFQKSIRVFNEGMSIKPSYLPLEEASLNLQNMLREQSKPVPVNFVSDGKTWVSIAGFEMLGRFEQKTARIYPGNYKVRGRRKGYRDILLEIRVRSGRDFGLVKVICFQRS